MRYATVFPSDQRLVEVPDTKRSTRAGGAGGVAALAAAQRRRRWTGRIVDAAPSFSIPRIV
jgi:hypothetical protein